MKKLLFILSLGILFNCSNEQKDYVPDLKTTEGIEKYADRASIIAKDFVKQNLKSPSTAKFPSSDFSYSNPEVDSRTITIKSYVDAENSFGATSRKEYYVKLRFKSGDWADMQNWELLQINVD